MAPWKIRFYYDKTVTKYGAPLLYPTNKSGALKCVMKDLKDPSLRGSVFRGGSIDGLMKLMSDNNGCVIGQFDELSTFSDNIDRNQAGNSERGAFLEIYNADFWSKHVKTTQSIEIEDPHYNVIAYTQPKTAIRFAQKENSDGFFQRFLVTLPKEAEIFSPSLMKALHEDDDMNAIDAVDMDEIMRWIHNTCKDEVIHLEMSPEVLEEWCTLYDDNVRYRVDNPYQDIGLSIRGKTLGQTVRVSGLITLLREAVLGISSNDENYSLVRVVTIQDWQMASHIVEYSKYISSALMCADPIHAEPLTPQDSPSSSFQSSGSSLPSSPNGLRKEPIPEPAAMTIDFLVAHRSQVKKLMEHSQTPMAKVSGDKIYPVINSQRGKALGEKFVAGICHLGLGVVEEERSGKSTRRVFKRYHPGDDNCPDREEVAAKYKRLDLE